MDPLREDIALDLQRRRKGKIIRESRSSLQVYIE
jgi:hypothetical protein